MTRDRSGSPTAGEILAAPCGHTAALPRVEIDFDPLIDHPVVCPRCARRWMVAFLAERCYGLRVHWADPR